MSTNKKSYPTTMGWRELVSIYREFGDNAQQCVDFVIDNIQPKADGYRMGFTQSPLRIFNKMVKFKPDGVYILYKVFKAYCHFAQRLLKFSNCFIQDSSVCTCPNLADTFFIF